MKGGAAVDDLEKTLLVCDARIDQFKAALAEGVFRLGPDALGDLEEAASALGDAVDAKCFAAALVGATALGPEMRAAFAYGMVVAVREAIVAATRRHLERAEESP